MVQLKKVIPLFLFTLLMLIKVSAFHIYSHQNDEANSVDNCEICDIAIESQSSDLDIPLQFTAINANNFVLVNCFAEKPTVCITGSNFYQLFSRPPPSIS